MHSFNQHYCLFYSSTRTLHFSRFFVLYAELIWNEWVGIRRFYKSSFSIDYLGNKDPFIKMTVGKEDYHNRSFLCGHKDFLTVVSNRVPSIEQSQTLQWFYSGTTKVSRGRCNLIFWYPEKSSRGSNIISIYEKNSTQALHSVPPWKSLGPREDIEA